MNKKLIVLVGFIAIVASGTGYAWYDDHHPKKPDAPVPRTGQTTCYDDVGNIISCKLSRNQSLYGQDAQLRKGVVWPKPRFKNNGNGTVTDYLTGLIWLRDANCSVLNPTTWASALDNTKELKSGDCGLTDGSLAGAWRVPNANELMSLVDFGYANPALSNTAGTRHWTEGDAFIGVVPFGEYWSSSTTVVPTVEDHAWIVQIGQGGALYSGRNTDGGRPVWPVRDARPR